MAVNFKARRVDIAYRVVTKENMTQLLNLMDTFRDEFIALYQSEQQSIDSFYEIRSGNEIYSGTDRGIFEALWDKKKGARNVKIVIKKLSQQGAIQSHVTLLLDKSSESYFDVLGPTDSWVSGVHTRFSEILESIPRRNRVINSVLTEFVVQVVAAFVLTVLAIYLTELGISHLKTTVNEFYVFIVIFLFLSNVWTYINRLLFSLRQRFYPKVDLLQRTRTPLTMQFLSLLGASAFAWAVTYILDLLFRK